MHLELIDATANATIACDEYRYKDNIALGSGLLVKPTMDKGYLLHEICERVSQNNSPSLFIQW